jgi:hypothetical protein
VILPYGANLNGSNFRKGQQTRQENQAVSAVGQRTAYAGSEAQLEKLEKIKIASEHGKSVV